MKRVSCCALEVLAYFEKSRSGEKVTRKVEGGRASCITVVIAAEEEEEEEEDDDDAVVNVVVVVNVEVEDLRR